MESKGSILIKLLFILQLSILCVSQQQDFDFFYFVQQWPGSFCDSQKSCCYPTSGKPAADFGIHGLWPNYKDGTYPSNCDPNSPFDQSQISDLTSRTQFKIYVEPVLTPRKEILYHVRMFYCMDSRIHRHHSTGRRICLLMPALMPPSSHILTKSHDKMGSPGGLAYGKANGGTEYINSRGVGASSGSDSVRGVATSSGPSLSPSSSVGSLSSEKSSLNPNAKV